MHACCNFCSIIMKILNFTKLHFMTKYYCYTKNIIAKDRNCAKPYCGQIIICYRTSQSYELNIERHTHKWQRILLDCLNN